MQKRKLDLNTLLSKYEGTNQRNQESPWQQRTYQRPTPDNIQQQFYQNRTGFPNNNNSPPAPFNPTPSNINPLMMMLKAAKDIHNDPNNDFSGKFSNSRTQLEQFLYKVRGALREQEKGLASYSKDAFKHIHDNFMWTHDTLKKEIISLLDWSFQQNQKRIKAELDKQSRIEPPQFAQVHHAIAAMDAEIQRLINQLKTSQYKRAIADIVLRDFESQLNNLRNISANAKTSYLQSIGVVEPDKRRVEEIKEHLSHLFIIRRNEVSSAPQQVGPAVSPGPIQSSIFNIFKPNNNNNQPLKQSGRKSFFNFGN